MSSLTTCSGQKKQRQMHLLRYSNAAYYHLFSFCNTPWGSELETVSKDICRNHSEKLYIQMNIPRILHIVSYLIFQDISIP